MADAATGHRTDAGRRSPAVFAVGGAASLVGVVEGLVLILHVHRCPPGWTGFDLDAPIGAASLFVTAPLLAVTVASAVAGFRAGTGGAGGAARRMARSSLAAVALTLVAMGIAVVLGWGVVSNLEPSASGCITF